jgi:serine phosphatase RsbU (regulator of sigma subunit)
MTGNRNTRVEPLEKIVEASCHLSAGGIIDAVVREVRSFAGTRPQFDNITPMELKTR